MTFTPQTLRALAAFALGSVLTAAQASTRPPPMPQAGPGTLQSVQPWGAGGASVRVAQASQAPAPTAAAVGGQPAAELRSATGAVFAQSAGAEARVVTAGTRLFVGDTVGTGKGAFALVIFGDGSRLALRPESAVAIKGFSFKPEDPAADQMAVQLLKGWLRNVSGQIGKRGNQGAFEMRVVDSTIGIRGTDFAVRYCDEECAAAPDVDTEGVLPQSGRLGQLLAADRPALRLRDGLADEAIGPGTVLRLGDVIASTDSEALIGLDDGTRLVLAPSTRLALRAEEDDRGRRALRLDVLEGLLRVATPAQASARLYGLLINAGQLLGVRQDAALDLRCERAAPPGAYACPSAVVTLRRGQAEVLSETGLRSLRPGVPERLIDPDAPAAEPAPPAAPSAPAGPQTGMSSATRQARALTGAWDAGASPSADPWAPQAHPLRSLRTYTHWQARQEWRMQKAGFEAPQWFAQAAPTPALPVAPLLQPPRAGGLFDPLDLPVEAARPPSAAERAQLGIYTAVFSGLIEVSNTRGQVLVPASQGAFVPLVALPPRILPAAPVFMERDRELERSRLFPGQCLR